MDLEAAALAAFERRRTPVAHIADHAPEVALACRDMAARFRTGGRLLVFGAGAGASDAAHVAVEFVHPVIVGKRALPALSLAADAATLTGISADHGRGAIFSHQIEAIGRPGDIALGLSNNGDDPAVRRGLEAAHHAGLLTIALVGGSGGAIESDQVATHCFVMQSDDPHVVKESNVTTYHVLWELVHVFLDTPGSDAPDAISAPDGVEALYPFLYGGSHSERDVLDSVAASTVQKVNEIGELRDRTGTAIAARLGDCAAELAAAFRVGATLWTFGNGGSSTDAQGVAHAFIDPPAGSRPLPALCLTSDAAILTALSNDIGFEVVFSRQLRAFGRAGDVAIGLSTSGGSSNVLSGFDDAKALGLHTVGIAGYGGGRMSETASIDHLFAVDSSSVHRVQEVQTTIYHVLWELTQVALMGSARSEAEAG